VPGQWLPFATPLLPPAELAPECTGATLRVTIPTGTVHRGHVGATILFLNRGEIPCDLRGYPGVAGLGPGGAQVAQARWTMAGFLGGIQAREDRPSPAGPPVVTLKSGQYASAMIEALDADLSASCRFFKTLLVTPPDATASIRIPVLLSHVVTELPDCGNFEVHPVTPGRSGGEGTTTMIEVGAHRGTPSPSNPALRSY
jgi:hypothetical protein